MSRALRTSMWRARLLLLLQLADALKLCRRRAVAGALGVAPVAARAASYQTQFVFEGGAGGLGKSKPNTGVAVAETFNDDASPKKLAPPGLATARLVAASGLPVDVSFDSPWPTSAGLVSRDYTTGDGAYVLATAATRATLEADCRAKIFAVDGKYGAYGPVADVKLRRAEPLGDGDARFEYTFTALSPAMREVERRVAARATLVGERDAFLLVAGTTGNRWKAALPDVDRVTASFTVKPAPDFSAEMQAFRNRRR